MIEKKGKIDLNKLSDALEGEGRSQQEIEEILADFMSKFDEEDYED